MTNPTDYYTTYTINGTPAWIPGFNLPASKYPEAAYFYYYIPLSAGICSATTVAGSNYSPAQCNRHNIVFTGPSANSGGSYSIANPANPRIFLCNEVYRIDSKYDDGKPFTGQIVLPGHNSGSHVCSSGNYPTGTYQTTATNGAIFSFVTNDR